MPKGSQRTFPLCTRVAEDEGFQTIILILILLSALGMGLESIPELAEMYGDYLYWFFIGSQIVFVFEIAVRLAAFAPKWRDFFQDFWNSFDFSIVALSLIPAIGPLALLARFFRVLRVIRVATVSDELRLFLETMRGSMRVIFRCFLVFLTIFYVYAVGGYTILSEIDPMHWGSLPRCGITLLYLSFLTDLQALLDPLIERAPHLLWFPLSYLGLQIVILLNAIGAVVALHRSRNTR